MNENLTTKEKIALKWNNFKNAAATKAHNLVIWVADHPVETASLIGATTTAVSKGRKLYTAHEERIHRERDFYDPRTGKYTRASRKLKSWELDEIEYRYARGESYNHILGGMGLRK